MPHKKNSKRGVAITKNLIIMVLGGITIFLIAILIAVNAKSSNVDHRSAPTSNEIILQNNLENPKLRFWSVNLIHLRETHPLRTINRIFENFQHKFVDASDNDDWDIVWSINQPKNAPINDKEKRIIDKFNEKQLRREQKVNHFEGIDALVNKEHMSYYNRHLPSILPIFMMPDDIRKLRSFLKVNPNVSIVERSAYEEHVKIIKFAKVNDELSDYFYQKFLDDPYLIDGYAFDMQIFVLITSFDPLRVYRYGLDVIFRFCAKKFHPFDPKDTSKYVTKDDGISAYEMPLFEKNYKMYQLPFVRLFEEYITEKGFNVREFWKKIDDAIVKIVNRAEKNVLEELKKLNHSSHNYFELVRFDFIFDSKLNPYVVEVNMSPNLTPSEKRHEQNIKLYDSLVYDTIRMIGGGSHFEFHSRFNDSDIMVAGQKHISAGVDTCLKFDCYLNCDNPKCIICLPCVSAATRFQMREAVREHAYAGNFKRVFPNKLYYNDRKLIEKMTVSNKISIEWFKRQCESDEKWC